MDSDSAVSTAGGNLALAASPVPPSLTPGYNGGSSNRTTQWPSSSAGRPLTGRTLSTNRDAPLPDSPPPMSPSDAGAGDIPIALSPSSQQPPAAPIAGSARTTTQTQTQTQTRGRFLEVETTRRPIMPFQPTSPPPPSVKWSRVRELRASLKTSKRIQQPLPSPTIHDGSEGLSPLTPTQGNLDLEKGVEGTKRKTLFQRAVEGWWELPGLIRSETIKGRADAVRGKVKPFPSTRRVPGGFI